MVRGSFGLFLAAQSVAPFGASPLAAQSESRIRGRVTTTEGAVHEGFLTIAGLRTVSLGVSSRGVDIRDSGASSSRAGFTGSSAASWADALVGARTLSDTLYHAWLDAVHDGVPTLRSVEVKGYRVTWEERHRDFAAETSAHIRFGRLESLAALEDNRVEVALREGGGPLELELRGWRSARVAVEEEGEEVRLRGREIERIDFVAAPPGARARDRRLHGSVEDRFGRVFTGFLAWENVPLFLAHRIPGMDRDGELAAVALGEVAAIEPRLGGGQVTLATGEGIEFARRAPLSRYNGRDSWIRWYRRPLRVADPGLGTVEIPWDEFRLLRIHPHDGRGTRADFGGGGALEAGRALYGTVTTGSGEAVTGYIRWDASRERRWEHLVGLGGGVAFAVELARIEAVEREEEGGALVTLRDGRSFELGGTADLDPGNRGLFVLPEEPGVRQPGEHGRYLAWEEIATVRFSDPPGDGQPPGNAAPSGEDTPSKGNRE